ncbi:putative glutathione S-transferase [Coniochaeta sp. 2T2.1]|nr:putative glutathione S-transferase [Coniochaeta sp. 2T2.1]
MVLTVHHLQMSQSERIPWLCEELGIDYELKLYKRSPMLAPPEYKALHPQGTAPVITDGDDDLVLAESGAVIEYIAHRHGGGRLFLPPSHPDYAQFLYWWHWGNATFMPTTFRVMAARANPGTPTAKIAEDRFARFLSALDERLKANEWLAGEEFTAADVMLVFPLTTWRYWSGLSWAGYDGILAYLQRIGKREAYQRAMAKSDPGMELLLGPDPPKNDRVQELAAAKKD